MGRKQSIGSEGRLMDLWNDNRSYVVMAVLLVAIGVISLVLSLTR
jgi:hypothetical protein